MCNQSVIIMSLPVMTHVHLKRHNHSSLKNVPECDYSSFYVATGTGNTGCLVAQDLALLTKVRTLIHEEISLLTVLYFPFRARTPISSFRHRSLVSTAFASDGWLRFHGAWFCQANQRTRRIR
jgi:hypothetical protein